MPKIFRVMLTAPLAAGPAGDWPEDVLMEAMPAKTRTLSSTPALVDTEEADGEDAAVDSDNEEDSTSVHADQTEPHATAHGVNEAEFSVSEDDEVIDEEEGDRVHEDKSDDGVASDARHAGDDGGRSSVLDKGVLTMGSSVNGGGGDSGKCPSDNEDTDVEDSVPSPVEQREEAPASETIAAIKTGDETEGKDICGVSAQEPTQSSSENAEATGGPVLGSEKTGLGSGDHPGGGGDAANERGRMTERDEAGARRRRRSPCPSRSPSPSTSGPSRSLSFDRSLSVSSSTATSPGAESVDVDEEDNHESDSSFDASEADDEDGSSDDDDSDGGFEVDVLPPPCYAVHKDRKTFKDSLCRECYEIYQNDLKTAGVFCLKDDEPGPGRRRKKKRLGKKREDRIIRNAVPKRQHSKRRVQKLPTANEDESPSTERTKRYKRKANGVSSDSSAKGLSTNKQGGGEEGGESVLHNGLNSEKRTATMTHLVRNTRKGKRAVTLREGSAPGKTLGKWKGKQTEGELTDTISEGGDSSCGEGNCTNGGGDHHCASRVLNIKKSERASGSRKKLIRLGRSEPSITPNAVIIDSDQTSAERHQPAPSASCHDPISTSTSLVVGVKRNLETNGLKSVPEARPTGDESDASGGENWVGSGDLFESLLEDVGSETMPTVSEGVGNPQASQEPPVLKRGGHSVDGFWGNRTPAWESEGDSGGLPELAAHPLKLKRGGSLDTLRTQHFASRSRVVGIAGKGDHGDPSERDGKVGSTLGVSKTPKPMASSAPWKGNLKVKGRVVVHRPEKRKLVPGFDRPGNHDGSSTCVKTDDNKKARSSTAEDAVELVTCAKSGYERVTCYRGVVRKLSNSKYFLWVGERLHDGKPYDTGEECAKEYDKLQYNKAGRKQFGARLNFGDANAPAHGETMGFTPLNSGKTGSRIAKKIVSGYSVGCNALPSLPQKKSFFAPRETRAGAAATEKHRATPKTSLTNPTRVIAAGGPTGDPCVGGAEQPPPAVAPLPEFQSFSMRDNVDHPMVRSRTPGGVVSAYYMPPEGVKIRWSNPLNSFRPKDGLFMPSPPTAPVPRSARKGGRARDAAGEQSDLRRANAGQPRKHTDGTFDEVVQGACDVSRASTNEPGTGQLVVSSIEPTGLPSARGVEKRGGAELPKGKGMSGSAQLKALNPVVSPSPSRPGLSSASVEEEDTSKRTPLLERNRESQVERDEGSQREEYLVAAGGNSHALETCLGPSERSLRCVGVSSEGGSSDSGSAPSRDHFAQVRKVTDTPVLAATPWRRAEEQAGEDGQNGEEERGQELMTMWMNNDTEPENGDSVADEGAEGDRNQLEGWGVISPPCDKESQVACSTCPQDGGSVALEVASGSSMDEDHSGDEEEEKDESQVLAEFERTTKEMAAMAQGLEFTSSTNARPPGSVASRGICTDLQPLSSSLGSVEPSDTNENAGGGGMTVKVTGLHKLCAPVEWQVALDAPGGSASDSTVAGAWRAEAASHAQVSVAPRMAFSTPTGLPVTAGTAQEQAFQHEGIDRVGEPIPVPRVPWSRPPRIARVNNVTDRHSAPTAVLPMQPQRAQWVRPRAIGRTSTRPFVSAACDNTIPKQQNAVGTREEANGGTESGGNLGILIPAQHVKSAVAERMVGRPSAHSETTLQTPWRTPDRTSPGSIHSMPTTSGTSLPPGPADSPSKMMSQVHWRAPNRIPTVGDAGGHPIPPATSGTGAINGPQPAASETMLRVSWRAPRRISAAGNAGKPLPSDTDGNTVSQVPHPAASDTTSQLPWRTPGRIPASRGTSRLSIPTAANGNAMLPKSPTGADQEVEVVSRTAPGRIPTPGSTSGPPDSPGTDGKDGIVAVPPDWQAVGSETFQVPLPVPGHNSSLGDAGSNVSDATDEPVVQVAWVPPVRIKPAQVPRQAQTRRQVRPPPVQPPPPPADEQASANKPASISSGNGAHVLGLDWSLFNSLPASHFRSPTGETAPAGGTSDVAAAALSERHDNADGNCKSEDASSSGKKDGGSRGRGNESLPRSERSAASGPGGRRGRDQEGARSPGESTHRYRQLRVDDRPGSRSSSERNSDTHYRGRDSRRDNNYHHAGEGRRSGRARDDETDDDRRYRGGYSRSCRRYEKSLWPDPRAYHREPRDREWASRTSRRGRSYSRERERRSRS